MGAGNLSMTTNALEAPSGSPRRVGNSRHHGGRLAPGFHGNLGRRRSDPRRVFRRASGGLRLTGIVTADVTVARGSQIEILTGLQEAP